MMLSGWEYVLGAYAVSWAAILLYAVSLYWRHSRLPGRPDTALRQPPEQHADGQAPR